MATNPMQKKARNSFLIGMLVTLLITGVIIALLMKQLSNTKKEIQTLQGSRIKVCVLNQSVTSGQVITSDMVTTIEVDKRTIPANSFEDNVNNIMNYSLEDAKGNPVQTKVTKDESGKEIKVTCITQLNQTTGQEVDRIIDSPDGENYYYEDTGEKVDLTTVPLVAKVDLEVNTVLTSSVLAKSNEKLDNDVRKVEYNMISLPSQLETSKYIDIRLSLPSGEDFIVVTHKQIEIPNVDGTDSLSTIWMNLNETEILTLNCAIVESYKVPGSKLYAIEYIEPGLQDPAKITYIPNDAIIALVRNDPNCLQDAKNALWDRLYNKDSSGKYTTGNQDAINSTRNPINNAIKDNEDNAADDVTTGVQNDIQKTQEERQKYLESLGGTY